MEMKDKNAVCTFGVRVQESKQGQPWKASKELPQD